MNSKKIAIILGGAFILAAISIAAGILLAPSERPLRNPQEFYQSVVQQLNSLGTHSYDVIIQSTTQVQGQEFAETTSLAIQHQENDGQPFVTVADRNVSMGDFHFSSLERLENTTLYIDLNGCRFYGEAPKTPLYPPELLLDASNYAQISGIKENREIIITFTEPSAAEEWALPEGAILQAASGTLKTTKDGTLLENTYRITYVLGQREVSQTITSVPNSSQDFSTDTLDPSGYTRLESIEAPILLERMSGYLLQSENIHTNYQEYIYCQTFGDQRTRNMGMEMRNTEPFHAKLTTEATLINSSRGENISTARQTETFENNIYTRQSNDADPITDNAVTADRFRKHCQDILVGTILLPQFISAASMEEDDSSITYHFSPTHGLAALLSEEASQNLYQDPTVLNSLVSDSLTEVLSAYLQIDKATGLPVSSGIHYKGIYTITELPYRLEYTTDQTYSFQ